MYRKYRPEKFSEVIGQAEAIAMLQEFGKRGAVPHCLLFTGNSGTGKTTLARIMRKKMKCGDRDYQELNTADFRGIDMVREIRQRMGLAPMEGKVRVWLVDECFPAGTMVDVAGGHKPIEQVIPGDRVETVGGQSMVKDHFVNKVGLDRIVRVHFGDGTSLVTTKQHEILTDRGWMRAIDLDIGIGVLSTSEYIRKAFQETPCGTKMVFSLHPVSRWEQPLIEEGYLQRCKEDPTARRVGVVGVEVYQRGINDESFTNVVSDSARQKGFVEFHDLQIAGHPSYFADGIPVHNCHKLTGDAQNAFLKMLEDPPNHVYFMLATTDPQKLLPTIRTRATEIKCKPLSPKDMRELLTKTYGAECGVGLNEDVRDKIVDLADGSPRKALVLLNQVLEEGDAEKALAALAGGVAEKEGIDLARMLLQPGSSWTQVAKTLKAIDNLDTQAEGIRRLVLAFMASVAVNGGKAAGRAIGVMDCFRDPYYDVPGKAGLALSCWDAVNLGRD